MPTPDQTTAAYHHALNRYRQARTPETLQVVQDTATIGYPNDVSWDRTSGNAKPEYNHEGKLVGPVSLTQPERHADTPDLDARRAQKLLDLISECDDIAAWGTKLIEHPWVGIEAVTNSTAKLTYAADQLEYHYDRNRQARIECQHCAERRDRALDECPHCGIPTNAVRCANPHHAAYLIPGQDTIRNGRCNPCRRYHQRTGTERPTHLIERETNARRTSDTQTLACINPACGEEHPWRDLRDGRCKPCAGTWASLGRERIPTNALALQRNMIPTGDDAA